MKYFVKDASRVNAFKDPELEKILKLGSRHRTPLNLKPIIEPVFELADNNKDENISMLPFRFRLVSLIIHGPESTDLTCNKRPMAKIYHVKNYVSSEALNEIFESVDNYDQWYGKIMEKDYINGLIEDIIDASVSYGEVKSNCANGFIADTNKSMREKGKILKDAKLALFEAIKLN